MAKFYYNGVLLPEIPQDVLAEYPYVFMVFVSTNGRYMFMASADTMYYSNSKVYTSNSNAEPLMYCVQGDESWTLSGNDVWNMTISSSVQAIWSNHDIPNGSTTATEIYFEGSKPIPEFGETYYQIAESTLTSFGDQARRINGTTDKLTTAQMLEIFEGADFPEDLSSIAGLLGNDVGSEKADIETSVSGLIGLANETTGNTDTNLTDGVNALVSGYGQGGIQLPEDMLEGLENGYYVMFYDENNKGLAFYSVKQGHGINPPEYSVKAWQTSDGTNITFPYTPSADIALYANKNSYASLLYEYYGIDGGTYPYVYFFRDSSNGAWRLYFAKRKENNWLYETMRCSEYYIGALTDYSDIESAVNKVMAQIPITSLSSGSSTRIDDYNNFTYYTNFDYTFSEATHYRLD